MPTLLFMNTLSWHTEVLHWTVYIFPNFHWKWMLFRFYSSIFKIFWFGLETLVCSVAWIYGLCRNYWCVKDNTPFPYFSGTEIFKFMVHTWGDKSFSKFLLYAHFSKLFFLQMYAIIWNFDLPENTRKRYWFSF